MRKIKITILCIALLAGAVIAQDRKPLSVLEITQADWLDIESAQEKFTQMSQKRDAAKAVYELYSTEYEHALQGYYSTLSRIFAPQGFDHYEYQVNASSREVRSRTTQADGSQEKKRWDRLERVR